MLSTAIVDSPVRSTIVARPRPKPCQGWNRKIRMKTPDQTIAWSAVQAMSAVNIVAKSDRVQVSIAARISAPSATFAADPGVTSS